MTGSSAFIQIEAKLAKYMQVSLPILEHRNEHARLLGAFWIFDVKLRSADADNTSI